MPEMFPLPIFGDMEMRAGKDDLLHFIAVITHGSTLCSHRNPLRMRVHRPRLAQVDRDVSVGKENLYCLNNPGIESRLRARFSVPIQTNTGPYPTSYKMGTGSLSRG